MNTVTSGQAVITKVIGGTNISLSSTGMDSGTGDVTISAANASSFVSKTVAYTLTTSDSGKYFICSGGSWTLTLPAPAVGLTYQVRNDMGIAAGSTTGTITISPTSATIDGASSLALLPQQECTLITDGTNWRTIGLKREVILGTLDITSSSASATVLLPVGYRLFALDIAALVGAVDSQNLQMQLSSDGGNTFYSTSYFTEYFLNSTVSALAAAGLNNVGYAYVGPIGAASVENQIKLYPGSSTQRASWLCQSEGYSTTNAFVAQALCGGMLALGTLVTMNAVKFLSSSGNITNMSLTVKGVV